jgi:ribosomal protein L22
MTDEEKNENVEAVEADDTEVEETPADVAAEEATDEEIEATDEVDRDEDDDVSDDEVDAIVEAAAPAEEEKPKRSRSRKAPEAAEEKPAKPAPRRSRGSREPGVPVPVVRAQAKYVRSSARKARLVCDHIRGKSVDEARAILAHTPRAVARDWSKLLESAVANAEHNHELVGEDLYVKAVTADEGPTIKRFRPRAQGRATKIRKRTAHLTILLTPKD